MTANLHIFSFRHRASCATWRAVYWRVLAGLFACLSVLVSVIAPAHALDAIVINPDQDQLEITTRGELYQNRGDSLQVETAPGPEGITGRVSVNASMRGTNPHWIVFALTNPSAEPVERLLTADRYNVVGSGIIWPDLDAQRIKAITPSIGFVPERLTSDRADVFRVTLEPGQTITYVMELSSDRFARIYLWKPLNYELKVKDRHLFHGILLGLTGLLAIFLTAVFVANHKLIFPGAALVSWSVLAYLCVDFGFFHKLFQLKPEDNAIYRAACEAAVAASFVVFLYVFLKLSLWNSLVRMLVSVWILAQLALVALAVIDPRLAATFARLSFVIIATVGAGFTLFLALRGQDRAMSLIPTWMLFCVWVFAAGVLLTGKLSGEMAVSGIVAFLVLIVISIGFTITQFAFRNVEPVFGAAPNEIQQRALAVDGAGAAVWQWNSRRDEVSVGAAAEEALGLKAGELSSSTDEFVRHIHPADRERFKLMLWTTQERGGGKIQSDFRLRHADNSYRWFELEAASIATNEARALRCVGLMRDVTDSKRAHERLVQDAVHDNLTNLPNRALFVDRLATTLIRAEKDEAARPAVLFIDIDKFKSVNNSLGLLVGDSLLLTVARRLQRHLKAEDTLARVGGDQFAMIVFGEDSAEGLAGLAERLRRSLRSPIKIAGQDIVLTGSMGIAICDETTKNAGALLKDAEIAMYRAKRSGSDHIELFRPEMRADRDDRVEIEADLRKALEKNQLKVLYQPVYALATEELAGFSATVRWDSPKYGMMNPTRFVPIAEESDLIVRIASQVLLKAIRDAARWHKVLTVREDEPLFVSVNVSSNQLFRQDLIQEIRHILGQDLVPRGALKLEVTEALVMENPEQAIEMLGWLKSSGASLTLDDFGTGFSSLSYLQRFPFDGIKIDQDLLNDVSQRDGHSSILVRSMVAMAHELEMTVVAEGIEHQDTAAFLRSIGTEYGQGYFYGEPITQREVIQMLRMLEKAERKLKPRRFFQTRKREGDEGAKSDQKPSVAPPPNSESIAKKGRVPARKPAPGVVAAAPKTPQPPSADRMAQAQRVRGPQAAGSVPPPPPPQPGKGTGPAPAPHAATLGAAKNSDQSRAPVSEGVHPAAVMPPPPPADQPPLPPPNVPQAQPGQATPPTGARPTSRAAAPDAASHAAPSNGSPPPVVPSTNGSPAQPPENGPAPAQSHHNDGAAPDQVPGKRKTTEPEIDYSKLPPSIAESLRKLAGGAAPPAPAGPPPLPSSGQAKGSGGQGS